LKEARLLFSAAEPGPSFLDYRNCLLVVLARLVEPFAANVRGGQARLSFPEYLSGDQIRINGQPLFSKAACASTVWRTRRLSRPRQVKAFGLHVSHCALLAIFSTRLHIGHRLLMVSHPPVQGRQIRARRRSNCARPYAFRQSQRLFIGREKPGSRFISLGNNKSPRLFSTLD